MKHKFTAVVTITILDKDGDPIAAGAETVFITQKEEPGETAQDVVQYMRDEVNSMVAAASASVENCVE